MEPKKLNKKLQLNKKIISDLDKIKAGAVATNGCNSQLCVIPTTDPIGAFTDGCTDGCGPIFVTYWNCTEANCTADCQGTDPFCTTKKEGFCTY